MSNESKLSKWLTADVSIFSVTNDLKYDAAITERREQREKQERRNICELKMK